MKPTNQLTELSIKQAKPKEKQYKLTDGEGMYLRVYPNGSKYWQLQYWFDGKQKILSFGIWPDTSLKEAREKRHEAKKQIKDGINPIEEKRKERQDNLDRANKFRLEEIKKTITFKKVSIEWYKRQALQWTEKHSADVLNSLKFHVYPDIGERPISDITKKDVIATLRELESEGKHETCYRVRQRLEAIFNYAEIEEHCLSNPARGLQKIFTKPQPKTHPSIPIPELPSFLQKIISNKEVFQTTRLAMMFMVHVFVRSKSQRLAKWNDFELDCDEPLWIVPALDMKMGIELHVPLTSQVVLILKEMKQFSGPDGYVFPQVRNPKKAMSANTLQYFSNRLGYAGRSTIHGIRTVASTVLNESLKWHPDVIELQLAHLVGSKVRRAYNRAEHLNERRKMMQWWSDYIESLTVK
jgi:integrase